TGLARPLEADSLPARAAVLASAGAAFVVALDVPSGLDGSRSSIIGPHVTADVTVTFGAPKIAHVLLPAAGACGRLVGGDLGLVGPEGATGVDTVAARDLAPLFPRRKPDAHKGSQGRLAIAGGSMGL